MKILVIGSGPAGLHFTLSALRKNHDVTLLDVGTQGAPVPLPEKNFVELKQSLADPVSFFLGEDFGGAVLPESGERLEYYNLPAVKEYVFKAPEYFRFTSEGIYPLVSFAKGGLAETWTAGCYPLDDMELSVFPFGYEDIKPCYSEVSLRIGIGGEKDDLRFPDHEHLSPPVNLDESSAILLSRYERSRKALIAKHRIRLGRSRQAALAESLGERDGCRYCGRCLWGCPNGALYTPALTFRDCTHYPNFTYCQGFFASHFSIGTGWLIDHLMAYPLQGGPCEIFRADAYVLAAGTLSTSNIILRSMYKSMGEILSLTGLTENRQVIAPFFNFGMLGVEYNPDNYQYHQLAIGLTCEESSQYIHGQITPLKTATVHPIIQSLPFDLSSATSLFSQLRSGLGVLNLNFCDWRREENHITLRRNSAGREAQEWPELAIRYRPFPGERNLINKALVRIRRFFLDIGAPTVPGLTRLRPMGSSVHYSGTLPMAREKKSWSVSENCQSYDIQNMFVVDGSVMPFLPAKNITFTLMANAVRVAAKAF